MSQSMFEENNRTEYSKQPEKKSGGRVFLILFFIIFVLGFGVLGVTMLRSAYRKEMAYTVEADGIVVDYRRYSHMLKERYSPIVEYRVGDWVFTGDTNVEFNYRPYKVGEHVSIYCNPENPEEFYIKEYDLMTTYKLGAIFLGISIGILAVSALFAGLGKIKMDKEKKARIEGKVFVVLCVLFIFTMFALLAGLAKAICIFAAMGVFGLYGMYQNKRKK